MKAAVFYGKHDIRIEERDIRLPKNDEVVVKVAYCGICGTDVHIYNGDEGSAEVTPPIVLGHEFSGIVREVGAEVKNVQPGDHVAIDPNFYCGWCYYCLSAKEHFCSGMRAIGVSEDGGFAEYCTVSSKSLVKLPPDIPLEVAAFAEPVACCIHGIDLTKIETGHQVLIIGAGSIGLLMLQLAKLEGASRVRVIEPNPNKRALAEKLGADDTFASGEEYFNYADKTDGLRADRIIECAGKAETVDFALKAASKGAVIMIFGLTPPTASVEILPFDIFKKELTITSSFVNPYTQARAAELLASGKLNVTDLIETRIPLEKLEEALIKPEYRAKTKILVDLH